MNLEETYERGRLAREFVVNNKNSDIQAKRILEFSHII